MGQLVDELKSRFGSKINFLVVFIDDEKEQPVVDRYNPQFTPTTLVFDKDGREKNTYSGVVNEDTLVALLEEMAK